MGFDTAPARLKEPGTAALALLPGLLPGLLAFGPFVPPARLKAGAGIGIPYPTTRMLPHARTEATDGDRARQREGWPARGGGQDLLPRWRVRDGHDRLRRPNGATAAGQAT